MQALSKYRTISSVIDKLPGSFRLKLGNYQVPVIYKKDLPTLQSLALENSIPLRDLERFRENWGGMFTNTAKTAVGNRAFHTVRFGSFEDVNITNFRGISHHRGTSAFPTPHVLYPSLSPDDREYVINTIKRIFEVDGDLSSAMMSFDIDRNGGSLDPSTFPSGDYYNRGEVIVVGYGYRLDDIDVRFGAVLDGSRVRLKFRYDGPWLSSGSFSINADAGYPAGSYSIRAEKKLRGEGSTSGWHIKTPDIHGLRAEVGSSFWVNGSEMDTRPDYELIGWPNFICTMLRPGVTWGYVDLTKVVEGLDEFLKSVEADWDDITDQSIVFPSSSAFTIYDNPQKAPRNFLELTEAAKGKDEDDILSLELFDKADVETGPYTVKEVRDYISRLKSQTTFLLPEFSGSPVTANRISLRAVDERDTIEVVDVKSGESLFEATEDLDDFVSDVEELIQDGSTFDAVLSYNGVAESLQSAYKRGEYERIIVELGQFKRQPGAARQGFPSSGNGWDWVFTHGNPALKQPKEAIMTFMAFALMGVPVDPQKATVVPETIFTDDGSNL